MNSGIVRVSRALISVSDKTGVADFAAGLASLGVELISTGGTAKALRDHGLTVIDVSELTDFPECFGGRLKTLHPMVHGGLLFDRDIESDVVHAERLGIKPIDLLVVNLYPFEQIIRKHGVSRGEAVENIDIGGPAMIRGAAKNHRHVAVVTSSVHYKPLLDELASLGGTSLAFREQLMNEAFQMTSDYDAAISNYFTALGPST